MVTPVILPAVTTPAITEVLSMMPWETQPIATALRAAGHDIPLQCEAEQAATMFWLLHLAIVFGNGWRAQAAHEIKRMAEASGHPITPTAVR